MVSTLLFLGFGALAGICAGLLGIGGGVIMVPALYYILRFVGFPENELMHVAVATSLTSTVITTIGASLSHHYKRAIDWKAIRYIAFGLFLGSVSGAILALHLGNELLRYIFGGALLPFSVYFFFPHFPIPKIASHPNWTLGLWSIAIGSLSSLLGIGGGVFMVPLLLSYRLHLKNAIGTSSAATFIAAATGSISFLLLSLNHPSLPNTFGNIEVNAFLALGFSSLITAPFGAKLAHHFSIELTQRFFASALAVTGLSMLLWI